MSKFMSCVYELMLSNSTLSGTFMKGSLQMLYSAYLSDVIVLVRSDISQILYSRIF